MASKALNKGHEAHDYDALLVVSFGGPEGPADVDSFLDNVFRGLRVPPETKAHIAKRYEHVGGVSPINAHTRAFIKALQLELDAHGPALPIYWGNRNWHPLLPDTLRAMHRDGARRAIGFIAAAQHSYSSCQQYRENVAAARVELRREGHDIDVTYVGSWYDHPRFIAANAAHVRAALARLPEPVRATTRLVFTAHSIPTTMAASSRYQEQLRESARLVAAEVGVNDWALVYQSRSGRPGDPWLEPDVSDYLRRERASGLSAVVLCPIGFVCDHIEVLYDLDREAAAVCREIGLPMSRAETVNDDPMFLDMMADVVLRTIQRYIGRPLPIAPRATIP